MAIALEKKTKQWCSREHYRLIRGLELCDSRSKTPAERQRCYQAAARTIGRRAKTCGMVR
jgi:hypothetical protein